jgi:hypothetical protein
MKDRWLCSKSAVREVLGWCFLWLGSAGALFGAQASASSPTAASLTSTQSVYLAYRELDRSLTPYLSGIPVVFQSTPFGKEPDFGQRKVVRGTFKFGDRANHFVPFILDATQGKLYLDLNRNQDLTDDPGGVYSCPNPGAASYVHTFNNVRLTFQTPMGVHPALLDLSFYGYGNRDNPPSVNVVRRYCWEGKLIFGGQEWQLGLTDTLLGRIGSADGGILLLRPWSSRNPINSPYIGSPDVLNFSRNLFFGGHAFQAVCSYVQQENHPQYRIDFVPQPAELGELKLTGQFIKRLVLTRDGDKPLTVVLDTPETVVKIPVGTYSRCRISLKQGETEAYRASDRNGTGPLPKAVIVNAREEAVLDMGGPLTNSVSVTWRGKSLVFNYQLVGARDEPYELLGARRQPEFAVYRANKKIASGKFEYG